MIHRCALAGAGLLALLLGACDGPQAVMDPVSPAARTLADLGWLVMWMGIGVGVVVAILVLVAALKRRGTLEEHLPHDASGGKSWILIGGFAAPAIILGVVFVSTLRTLDLFPLGDIAADTETIEVIGHQWWWEVRYLGQGLEDQAFTTANEIHIPVGRTVELRVTSQDVIHAFWAPKLHGKVDLIPGRINRIRLHAEEAGFYRGECAEYCGVQHAHMVFHVVAQPAEEYEAWKDEQRAEADVRGPLATQGREIFEQNACGLCHQIRGISPGGAVAPDLTHVASRQYIAAGTLRNTRGNLAAWVVDAPSLKPGTQMPEMKEFTGEELQALLAFLESLE